MAIIWSEEQATFIKTPIVACGRKAVVAYAGCGKTTTLIGYAQVNPNKRFLYLCLNNTIAKEAQKKFPKNVECRTFHSLAFREIGHQYKDRLEGNIKPGMFTAQMAKFSKDETVQIALAYVALNILNKWFSSSDTAPSTAHIRQEDFEHLEKRSGINPKMAVDAALSIFTEMVTGTSPVSHGCYLKQFSLIEPELAYHSILVDEAQDISPVVHHVLSRQTCEVVRVGDKYQSIYEFTGAINTLNDPENELFWLTTTYRFGQNLADAATAILMNLCGSEKPLVGKGKLVSTFEKDELLDEPPLQINRTKIGILNEILDLNKNGGTCGKIYMPSGAKNYGFNQLLDMYQLFKFNKSQGSMSEYKSWQQFQEVTAITGSIENKRAILLIEKFKGMVPKGIITIYENEVTNPKEADIKCTTAHKSKGLEDKNVILGNDYMPKCEITGELIEQEVNLMYVALTRAEQRVHISNVFHDLLSSAKYRVDW